MSVKEIKSSRNPRFRGFVKLTRTRGIKKSGLALMSGRKQVREVLRDFPDRCKGLLMTHGQDLPVDRGADTLAVHHLSPELFRQIDLFDTGDPIILVRFDPFPHLQDSNWPPGCTLCIPFQDPANVGAVIRSAAAFGVSAAVILKDSAHPFHPRALRAAGPAVFRLPLIQGPFLSQLDVTQVPVMTLSAGGRRVDTYPFPEAFCLVPGLEGPGLPPHLRNQEPLSIPMEAGVESLNAATATGIALYVWSRRLESTPVRG
jgi:tRNA G18 (ribose-2'-O)-methylase SpoU